MCKYSVGMRVRAIASIIEGEDGSGIAPDLAAYAPGISGYVYAKPGDDGTIEYVDSDGVPTVRFDRTGTATIVGDHEIAILTPAMALKH